MILHEKSFTLMNDSAYIKKKGRNSVTVDDLVHLTTPKGRGKNLFFPCNYQHLIA